jgi:hypothetical protein
MAVAVLLLRAFHSQKPDQQPELRNGQQAERTPSQCRGTLTIMGKNGGRGIHNRGFAKKETASYGFDGVVSTTLPEVERISKRKSGILNLEGSYPSQLLIPSSLFDITWLYRVHEFFLRFQPNDARQDGRGAEPAGRLCLDGLLPSAAWSHQRSISRTHRIASRKH